MNKNNISKAVVAVAAMAIFTSCTTCGPEPVSNKAEFTVKMNIPSVSQAKTYALSQIDENHIQQLDVLVFKEVVPGVECYLYRVAQSDIISLSNVTASGDQKEYKLRLAISDLDKYRIVMLANMRSVIDSKVTDVAEGIVTKEDLLAKLEFAAAGKLTDASDYVGLPMWGETKTTVKTTEDMASNALGTIGMLRAVARIDVGVGYDAQYVAQGLQNFKLSDVYVLNTNDIGCAAPVAANYSKDAAGFATVSAPSLSLASGVNNTLEYAATEKGVEREIYIAEVAANNKLTPTVDELRAQFHLVVGGYFSTADQIAANTPNTTKKTWYRIDVYDRSKAQAQGNQLDILRNHCYKVGITSVSGPGAETPEEATDNERSLDMITTVTEWVAGGTDGQIVVQP